MSCRQPSATLVGLTPKAFCIVSSHAADTSATASDPSNSARSIGKRLFQLAPVKGPELAAAPDEILPHPRLRLVDAERDGLPHGREDMFLEQPLFVEGVPGFVQGSEQRRRQESL